LELSIPNILTRDGNYWKVTIINNKNKKIKQQLESFGARQHCLGSHDSRATNCNRNHARL